MPWYYELPLILLPAILVFRLFRSRIKPLDRVMTWFVFFFVAQYAVGLANQIMDNFNLLPETWRHLPLQMIATALLVLYVPIRSDQPAPAADKKESAAKASAPSTTRRFRKK